MRLSKSVQNVAKELAPKLGEGELVPMNSTGFSIALHGTEVNLTSYVLVVTISIEGSDQTYDIYSAK